MTSLEIVNRDIEYYKERIEEHEKYCKDYPDIFDKENYEFNIVCLNEQKQIKQDLEKYNKVMKLLKNLFKEIKLEQEDWDGCSIFYMEDLKFDTYEISNELFSILDDLKILVGDSQ